MRRAIWENNNKQKKGANGQNTNEGENECGFSSNRASSARGGLAFRIEAAERDDGGVGDAQARPHGPGQAVGGTPQSKSLRKGQREGPSNHSSSL